MRATQAVRWKTGASVTGHPIVKVGGAKESCHRLCARQGWLLEKVAIETRTVRVVHATGGLGIGNVNDPSSNLMLSLPQMHVGNADTIR